MNKAKFIIQSETSNALIIAGLPAHLKGFHFVRDAVILAIKNPDALQNLTKELYPCVGEKYNVSGSLVERSIRNAIDYAFDSESLYGLNTLLDTQYFTGKVKPPNGNFIALLAEVVKNKILKIIAGLNDNNIVYNQSLINDLENEIGEFKGNKRSDSAD